MKKYFTIEYWWFWSILTVLAKVLISLIGHNYDLESSVLIGDIVSQGENVYAKTHRYNYGPLWGYVLGLLRWIQLHVFQSNSFLGLHMLIALILGFVDVGIATLLKKMYTLKTGFVFLLNPVSLLISGFHGQFDNVAVLFAILGVYFLLKQSINKSILGLSLSLITKHIFAFFAPWLLFNKNVNPFSKKPIVVMLPIILFVLSFIPFITNPITRSRVVDNVLGYSLGRDNALLTKVVDWVFLQFNIDIKGLLTFLPQDPAKIIFVLIMLILGIIYRKRPLKQLLPIYLIALLAFTSQMSDQYLAIPLIGVAIFWKSWWMRAYLSYTTIYLLLDASSNIGELLHNLTAKIPLLSTALNVVVPQLLLFGFLLTFSHFTRKKQLAGFEAIT